MIRYALGDRKNHLDEPLRGLSCDEDGVFIAGDVPLIFRRAVIRGGSTYAVRPVHELEKLLTSAYGRDRDFSTHSAGLHLVARYMNQGKWVLAKIASVHLRLGDITDDFALAKLLRTEAGYLAKHCSTCGEGSARAQRASAKQDVSNEPRVPAGQSGGGEWTGDGGNERQLSNPMVIPAQAIAPPMPVPMPFDLPLPPTEIAPFPFAIPGEGLKPPLANPYPNRRKCVKEWAEAQKFCEEQRRQKKLKPGYGGFGKDVQRCIQVSGECGGNPTA